GETETLFGDGADERGAGLVRRVVELAAAVVLAVVLGVFRREEGALMVVEPPRQARIARVFEIHDGVHIAIPKAVLKQLGCLVGHPRIDIFRFRVKGALHEAGEICGGSSAVETMVVIKNAYPHELCRKRTSLPE